MKKYLLVLLTMCFLLSLAFSDEMQIVTNNKKAIDTPQGRAIPQTREVPAYTFTKIPTAIITNYYDYMIGSYNGLPLRVIPSAQGGGYFMTYHGRRQATATRRTFYTYIDAAGNVLNNNEITSVQNHEGYPTVAVDPVSGKPIYAWHANADADGEYEVQVATDAFMAGLAGLFNDVQVAVDSPITMTSPSGVTTTDNEFIWPTAQIGPSPVNGKRRVYLACRNSSYATQGPSENLYLAYADFDGTDIENGVPLTWNFVTIPEMNDWNVAATWRRPFHALACDDAGNVYYVGYHFAVAEDGTTDIDEPDMDVFKCPNYGQGTWERVSRYSDIPSWNPPDGPGSTTDYFVDANSVPYADTDLSFAIVNSAHVNAVVDNDNKIHCLAVWGLTTVDGSYYPAMQYVKEFTYTPGDNEWNIKEVYPQKDPADTYNQSFCPWDLEAPWGEVDQYGGDATNGWYPLIADDWPFCHWDTSAHGDAMLFHYNNTKISEANDEGMMVALWQNARRARYFNYYSDTEFSAYANTPEMWMSVSPDQGQTWSEPIVFNNVDTPQLAGLKPMWTYPADKVIYTGMQGNQKVGKIGVMFYNDFTWGSNAITPSYHPTPDGGEVMFMEIEVVFPVGVVANDDNTAPAVAKLLNQNYPNPFNPETTLSFDMPKSGFANLSIYNVKGQLIKTLTDGNVVFGKNSFVWNGTDNNGKAVTSGLYFARLTTADHTESMKMMLMK
jgi:hypothetical protein